MLQIKLWDDFFAINTSKGTLFCKKLVDVHKEESLCKHSSKKTNWGISKSTLVFDLACVRLLYGSFDKGMEI